jgi:hypothetical protein
MGDRWGKTLKMRRILLTLVAFAVISSATPVMTNQTVEAMLRGGVPVPTIVTAIKTAEYIELFTSTEFYNRLLNAGASHNVADQIVQAMHDRNYKGAVRPEDINPVPVAVAIARPPVAPTPVARPVETPAPVAALPPPVLVPAPGVERNWTGPAKVSPLAYAPPPTAVPDVAPGNPRLGADRRLYISPMEGKLDGFIAAEIIKEHLPVHIVLDDKDVDLVLVGQSLKEDDHWYNAVWGGEDKNEGNLRLIDGRSRSLVWAGEAGDRSLIYGNLKRGGERKVAERLVRRMKKDYFRSTE